MTRFGLGKRLLLGIACCAPMVAAVGCADTPASPRTEPRPAIDVRAALVRDVAGREFDRQQLVGLSVAVAENGRLVVVEHFGFEDRERGVRTSDASRYRWASISKPLTAVVAMQLAREGKLELDADVRRYVPEFPEKPWPITARQLLCHQGGIVHYVNGKVVALPPRGDVEHPYLDAVDALGKFSPSPLLHEPGTKYSYTTHGYVLLGAVAQRAAGEPYPKLVHERIARRLGMTTLEPDYEWIEIPHRTPGYQKDGIGRIVPSDDVAVSWKLPGGGFLSTVGDLARFGIGMVEGQLVDEATRTAMWTRQITRSGAETEYGLGFRVGQREGELQVTHGGAQEKTRTFLLLLPERRLVIALMTNSEYAKLEGLAHALGDAWKRAR